MQYNTYYNTVFPGNLCLENTDSIDWGNQNLLAYGSCNYIVIVDTFFPVKIVQTLDGHSKSVTKVRWSNQSIVLQNKINYSMKLASGDESGAVFVWNVIDGTIISSFNSGILKSNHLNNSNKKDGSKKFGSVIDIKWHPINDNLLIVVHSTSVLILCDISTSDVVC